MLSGGKRAKLVDSDSSLEDGMSVENLPQDGELPDQVMNTDDDPPDRGIDSNGLDSDDLIKDDVGVDNLPSSVLGHLPDPALVKAEMDSMSQHEFDPSIDMSELLMNGAVDPVSMMDMPLFNEVDSLMNIKHEDHLNDTVIYLPMSYPLDNNFKVDNTNVSEPSLMVTDSNTHNALFYMAPEMKNELPLFTNVTVPQVVFKPDITSQASSIVNDQLKLNLAPLSNCSASTPFKSVMIKNIVVRNSTDILANSLGVIGNGQGHASALEHMLVSDTGTTTMAVKPVKTAQDLLCSGNELVSEVVHQPPARIGGRKGVRRASDGQLLSSDSSLDCSLDVGHQLKQCTSMDGTILKISSKTDSPLGSPELELGRHDSEVEAGLSSDGEIDRFVICSDHTMECVLCSFSTDSYSAFKSHIICSHPCWRITKKLSKNRLLVEKSVKASTSFNLNLDPAQLKIRSTNGSKEEDPYLNKISRKLDRNPRKRQLFERNKRLFKCTLCLRLFVFEGSVVNHVTEHHKENRPYDYIHISNDHGQNFGPIYRCQQQNCYFSCESERELDKHNVERHTQVIYRCQLCGYTADSAAAVHSHGIRMHQQQLTCFDQV